jgi:transcriptional regulator with XRE-family HTH domain
MSDDVAVGRMVHDVRVARNLRQEDVAARAGVGRTTVARLEHGLLENMTVAHLRAISRALEMPSVVAIGWRSPEVDRLRDRLHAAMVEQVGTVLLGLGWQIVPESSFNYYGDRGSADLLAWHEASGSLLIIEIKTRLWDIQDVLSAIDRKWRVMPGVVARARKCRIRRVGWCSCCRN